MSSCKADASTSAAHKVVTARLFERDTLALPVDERITLAATRLDDAGPEFAPPEYVLRTDQLQVFHVFATFLLDVATRPPGDDIHWAAERYGRIILPPRTGKTVIAAHILARCRLVSTFIVPTRTLVVQAANELRARMPGVPVGVYFGERKEIVEHGVNVATYALLQRVAKQGALPDPLARSALVFADEAHRAMTADRLRLLRHAFLPGAVRVALTATPDYDDERLLCRFFPELIHEVTLEEALALGLLAPARVWVAEVDAQGSRVRVLAGDYEEAALGRVMSTAPFARAVEVFRYRGANAAMPALIACTTRQQAHDLTQYLIAHRPVGAPPPELVLGDTSPEERARILSGFEAGAIDTLVQVGVLIEGWSSPRCKLLIDLAPTLSRVRATQKYFRVMTRHHGADARIYILLPTGLPELPVLPTELFGRSCSEYECGDLLGESDVSGTTQAIDRTQGSPVAGVTLKKRIVLATRLVAPRLDRTDLAAVRAVMGSCRAFDPAVPCGLRHFQRLRFDHPLFAGRGDFLLRWLGVAATTVAYQNLLARVLPDAAGHLLLGEDGRGNLRWCREDARHLLRAQPRVRPDRSWHRPEDGYVAGLRALAGPDVRVTEPDPDPLERLLRLEEADSLAYAVCTLPTRQRLAVARWFGLLGEREHTLQELADDECISRERIRQVITVGQRKLRFSTRRESGVFRVIDTMSELPPELAGWRRSHYGVRRWATRRQLCEVLPPWTELPSPIPVRGLPAAVDALLARLHVQAHIAASPSEFTTWLADGVTWGRAVWCADDVRLELLRHGHASQDPDGGESIVLRLWAEISGLPQRAKLALSGRQGLLSSFTLEEEPEGAVEAVWRDLNGLAPRPIRRRRR
ncbi:MAG: DEAD/DEAH box helicase family protein [Myxococcales bacterium]|nr:DEAD/DEAH box helicase family protein [Myxococcales bacterium]